MSTNAAAAGAENCLISKRRYADEMKSLNEDVCEVLLRLKQRTALPDIPDRDGEIVSTKDVSTVSVPHLVELADQVRLQCEALVFEFGKISEHLAALEHRER